MHGLPSPLPRGRPSVWPFSVHQIHSPQAIAVMLYGVSAYIGLLQRILLCFFKVFQLNNSNILIISCPVHENFRQAPITQWHNFKFWSHAVNIMWAPPLARSSPINSLLFYCIWIRICFIFILCKILLLDGLVLVQAHAFHNLAALQWSNE